MDFLALVARVDAAALRHLGEPVVYTTGAGAAKPVRGVYDAAYVKVEAGNAGVSSCGPAVFFRLADLPSDPREDDPTVSIRGVSYTTHTVEPDGQGGVRLLLHREAP